MIFYGIRKNITHKHKIFYLLNMFQILLIKCLKHFLPEPGEPCLLTVAYLVYEPQCECLNYAQNAIAIIFLWIPCDDYKRQKLHLLIFA